jgi:hypothetical protein
MIAILTSIPKTARAQAAVAAGKRLPADSEHRLAWHALPAQSLGFQQLRNPSYAPARGSVGATVT